jgi:hypothetical protein
VVPVRLNFSLHGWIRSAGSRLMPWIHLPCGLGIAAVARGLAA